jgi:hypothetical protein
MAESDELGRTLALARAALRGPAAMKERLRAELGANPTSAPAPTSRSHPSRADTPEVPLSPAPLGAARPEPPAALRAPPAGDIGSGWLGAGRRLLSQRFHLATVTLLVGVGFGAGFWLGRMPSERDGSASAVSATRRTSDSESIVGAPLVEADARSATDDGRTNDGAHESVRSSPAPGSTSSASAPQGPPPREAPSATTPSTTAGAAASGIAASPAKKSSAGAAKPPRSKPAAHGEADDALVREVALLERIERAIRGGQASLALVLLDELDQKVPEPALGDERNAARVLAQCLAAVDGDTSEMQSVRSAAQRALEQSPASVYADRIRSSCGLAAEANRRATIEESERAGH